MPIFLLNRDIDFPPVDMASEEGIVAVGGDLKPERLLSAYRRGIFPWYSEPDPILWWSPDPRCVLYPGELRVSESMRRVLKRGLFRVSADTAFREVMSGCSEPRRDQPGTWITQDMLNAYCRLHELGYAHSVEVWRHKELVGGLYGVSLGSIFVGESMFHRVANASKAGFITLVRVLTNQGFSLVDCQVHSPHLESLGAIEIPRTEYCELLENCLKQPDHSGNWGEMFALFAEKNGSE